MGILSQDQIESLGFGDVGLNVRISDRCSIYGASRISIGDNVRIDDFTVLSAGTGGIRIGRNIHIAVFTSLIGSGPIVVGDFANLSSRVAVYSSNDDYSGEFMTNPTLPDEFTNVTHDRVHIGKHVIIGCGSVILPGVTIGEGAAIGALSLIKSDCEPFKVYAGAPARLVKERRRDLLQHERSLPDLSTSE